MAILVLVNQKGFAKAADVDPAIAVIKAMCRFVRVVILRALESIPFRARYKKK